MSSVASTSARTSVVSSVAVAAGAGAAALWTISAQVCTFQRWHTLLFFASSTTAAVQTLFDFSHVLLNCTIRRSSAFKGTSFS